MKTKTIIAYLLLLVFVAAGIIGCNKDGVLDEGVSSYYAIETSFVNPSYIISDYIFLLDGDTLKNGRGYVSRAKSKGKLEVFKKGNTTVAYSQEISISNHQTIRFIALGNKIDLYSENRYTTFLINLAYNPNENSQLYKLFFNKEEITSGQNTFIRSDELTGTLEVQKEGVTVYSEKITVKPKAVINLLQLSEKEYLKIPPTQEEAPKKPMTKARFFYFPEGVSGIEKLELTLYYMYANRREFEKIATLTMKPGEITEYVLIDWTKLSEQGQRVRTLSFDLKNLATGELLIDHTVTTNEHPLYGYSGIERNRYKFATAQIVNNGKRLQVAFGERWSSSR